MKYVNIEGKRYTVLDFMGFQHSRGVWAVEVQTDAGPRIATKTSRVAAKWEWAGPAPIHARGPIGGQ